MFTVMEIIPQIILVCFFSSTFPMLSDWQSKLHGKPWFKFPSTPFSTFVCVRSPGTNFFPSNLLCIGPAFQEESTVFCWGIFQSGPPARVFAAAIGETQSCADSEINRLEQPISPSQDYSITPCFPSLLCLCLELILCLLFSFVVSTFNNDFRPLCVLFLPRE